MSIAEIVSMDWAAAGDYHLNDLIFIIFNARIRALKQLIRIVTNKIE